MQLTFDSEDLRPLIEAVAAEVVARVLPLANGDPERLAWTEEEAARLCGINRHNLRDARLAGKIQYSRLGKRVAYTREALVAWVAARRGA